MVKDGKIKEPVRLRRKALKDGNESLYLDIYMNGKRKYEFLKLYLVHERTRQDREQNRQTMQIANAVKAKRIVEMQNAEYGFGHNETADVSLLEYFTDKVEEKRTTRAAATYRNWIAMFRYLSDYVGSHDIMLTDVDSRFVDGFKKFLGHGGRNFLDKERELKQNSKDIYFKMFRSGINDAYADDLIRSNPCKSVKNFKQEESRRMYLTVEELRRLADTPCRDETLKRMFLFSALCGMRYIDIVSLRWGDVYQNCGMVRIIFRQRKTKGSEYLDITEQAVSLMGERGEAGERIFNYRRSKVHMRTIITKWVADAGIDKHITFHCARHTFATMMLDIGTDIYTVSKLLGHRELSTTQIYAKILDKNKQKAVQNIPDIL